MKLKITYKEVSLVLGILVAMLAIVSYWLMLHRESPFDATLPIHPMPNFEITNISKFIQTTIKLVLNL